MKVCTKCGVEKDNSCFQKRQASKDGFTASCKKCLSDYDKRRANLPHRVKAREDYQKTEKGLIASGKAKKKWTDNNAIKRGANIIVGNAVRDGRLIKQEFCSVCGLVGVIIHGHHDDYAKPLTVSWLCSQCHNDWHEINGEGLNG